MSAEQPLIQEKYMSLEMAASLEQRDGVALKAEIERQKMLETPTSAWLEVVAVQYEARSTLVSQKVLWMHIGSIAATSRYAHVSMKGRAGVLRRELDDARDRLGPLYDEISSERARANVRSARITALSKYDDEELIKSLITKGKRPITSIPDIDEIIRSSRAMSKQQRAHMHQLELSPAFSSIKDVVLKATTEKMIAGIDVQLGAITDKVEGPERLS